VRNQLEKIREMKKGGKATVSHCRARMVMMMMMTMTIATLITLTEFYSCTKTQDIPGLAVFLDFEKHLIPLNGIIFRNARKLSTLVPNCGSVLA